MNDQNQNVDQMFKLFVDKLMKEKGLGSLPEDLRNEMKSDLLTRIENRINAFILNQLPEEKLPKFESLLDDENCTQDQLHTFFNNNISNLDEKIASELLKFRDLYLKN